MEPGLDLEAQVISADVARLGLAVAVGDLEAPCVAVGLEHVRSQRLAGGDRAAQRRHRAKLVRFAASIRYSVGAWQSTLTPSRSHSARRSAGSNRASQISAAAPVSQGATKTLRADFDQPVAVVTQTRSSLFEPTQCSAWPRCAGRYEAV